MIPPATKVPCCRIPPKADHFRGGKATVERSLGVWTEESSTTLVDLYFRFSSVFVLYIRNNNHDVSSLGTCRRQPACAPAADP